MTANTFGTLNILIKHAHDDKITSFLPDSLLVKPAHPQNIPLHSLAFTMSWISTIHPSWIAAAMKELPLPVQNELLAWLPRSIAEQTQKLLPNSAISEKRSVRFGAIFLLDILAKKIRPTGIIDEIFLPVSPFNALLYYPHDTRLSLISCLGLFTLAKELRNILDNSIIERVHQNLNEKERLFLNYCLARPLRYLEPTSFLSSWDTSHNFHRFIHTQGLDLLAKAIINENASLLWYLLRRLDTGRGSVLRQALARARHNPHTDYFKERIIQCIKVLVK